MHAHQPGEVAACSHRSVDFSWDGTGFVPVADKGLDFVGYPFADFGAEGGVRFVEVGRVVLFRTYRNQLSVLVYRYEVPGGKGGRTP